MDVEVVQKLIDELEGKRQEIAAVIGHLRRLYPITTNEDKQPDDPQGAVPPPGDQRPTTPTATPERVTTSKERRYFATLTDVTECLTGLTAGITRYRLCELLREMRNVQTTEDALAKVLKAHEGRRFKQHPQEGRWMLI